MVEFQIKTDYSRIITDLFSETIDGGKLRSTIEI